MSLDTRSSEDIQSLIHELRKLTYDSFDEDEAVDNLAVDLNETSLHENAEESKISHLDHSSSHTTNGQPANDLALTTQHDSNELKPASTSEGTPEPKKTSKKAALIRSTDYIVPSTLGERVLTSWRMQDHAYQKDPCPFPTRARGLFTEVYEGQPRIVTRGYDKFFNVGEVSWTKWENMQELTVAPYYLTVKSNGCIIFISALSPTELLVTSKHSLGQIKDALVSHAEKGEEWLDKTLASAGKTREDLAADLWSNNLTAVAELCDDSFEEHVLPYSPKETGLHLHGLNRNSRTLLTLPPASVTAFAQKYGFLETAYIVLDTLSKVKDFTDECAKSGMWEGKYVEGFVVRCHFAHSSASGSNASSEEEAQEMFFFKVKFEEPYLRWREWRELTKRMVKFNEDKTKNEQAAEAARQQKAAAKEEARLRKKEAAEAKLKAEGKELSQEAKDKEAKKAAGVAYGEMMQAQKQKQAQAAESADLVYGIKLSKIQHPQTKSYVSWVAKALSEHPDWFADFIQNKGIVRIRDQYLDYEKEHGLIVPQAVNEEKRPFDRTVLVTIAVPGCGTGKTLMSVALSHLFGFGHTQSDDVEAKSTKALFKVNIVTELSKHEVVIADRNNHEVDLRGDLATLVSSKKVTQQHSVRLIALNWTVGKLPGNLLHRLCTDRILDRGEKHQSLRPDPVNQQHEIIFSRFVRTHEPFNEALNGDSDGHFDAVVNIDPSLPKLDMLCSITSDLCPLLSLEVPSEQNVLEALQKAEQYAPKVYKKQEEMTAKVRYYGIALEIDLASFLDRLIDSSGPANDFLAELKKNGRVEQRPHVTIVHEKEVSDKSLSEEQRKVYEDLWSSCESLAGQNKDVKLTLGPRLVWDGRCMSLEVSQLSEGEWGSAERMKSFHVTVGTARKDINGVEGKWLMTWLQQGKKKSQAGQEMQVVEIGQHEVEGRVKGLI